MSTIEKSTRRDEMIALIELQKQSNQTNKYFCEQQGIAQSCFYYWQKKYRQEQTGSSGFVPVLVKRSSSGLSQSIEINYPSGVSITVPAGANITLIKSLVSLI
jgi:hypothetical protein